MRKKKNREIKAGTYTSVSFDKVEQLRNLCCPNIERIILICKSECNLLFDFDDVFKSVFVVRMILMMINTQLPLRFN